MNDEQIKKIIEGNYDDLNEDSYRAMIRDFFSKQMRWVMLTVYIWFFIFLVPIIISIIFFFITDEVKFQIMYATVFLFCSLCIGFLKVLSWVMVSRHNIKREVKRLELRIAELAQTVKEK